MEFEVLLMIGLKVTSVIDSSILLSIMCLLVSLMSHVECLHWDHFCFCCMQMTSLVFCQVKILNFLLMTPICLFWVSILTH